MAQAWERLTTAASRDERVLVCGESGAGVGWLCERVHEGSARARAPIAVVNSHATPKGAVRRNLIDALRVSRGGTPVVRQIQELDSAEHEFVLENVYEQRLVATMYTNATARSTIVDERERLRAVAVIEVPPLRERLEDIPELASIFWMSCGRAHGDSVTPIPFDLLAGRASHDWPGNVRDLRNLVTLEYERRSAV